MPTVSAIFVRLNRDAEPLPNGVVWYGQFKMADGTPAYSVASGHESGEVQATRYKNARATYGRIPGTKMLLELRRVGECHYAIWVARDEDASYRKCPHCAFMDSLSVTSPQVYLEHTKRFQQLERDGQWEIQWNEIPEKELYYSSDRHLLRIRCLECHAQFSCETAADRQHAGIHYTRLRHSFVEL